MNKYLIRIAHSRRLKDLITIQDELELDVKRNKITSEEASYLRRTIIYHILNYNLE